jgi:two-component system, sensor histidine kinase and response regulator
MAKKTILVVENDLKTKKVIDRAIAFDDWSIVTTASDRQGVIWAKQHLPNLIFCRFDNDKIDGSRIIKEIKDNWLTAHIPVIFIAKKADFSRWQQFIDWGAEDFLVEPLTKIELRKSIFLQLEKQAKYSEKRDRNYEHLCASITRSLPHELRTAVTGILTATDFLHSELESLDLSIVRETINCINSSGNRLAKLIQNFLIYGEIELIKTIPERIRDLRTQQTHFTSLVVREAAKKLAKASGRENDLKLELEDAPVQIGKDRLLKLVEELVDNACKFSEVGEEIRISSICRQSDWILLVSDRGRGMSAEQIERVGAMRQFDRQVYEQQGAGLGLAIAKCLAELYGGQLTVQSIINRGTIVRVYLPKADFKKLLVTDRSSKVVISN